MRAEAPYQRAHGEGEQDARRAAKKMRQVPADMQAAEMQAGVDKQPRADDDDRDQAARCQEREHQCEDEVDREFPEQRPGGAVERKTSGDDACVNGHRQQHQAGSERGDCRADGDQPPAVIRTKPNSCPRTCIGRDARCGGWRACDAEAVAQAVAIGARDDEAGKREEEVDGEVAVGRNRMRPGRHGAAMEEHDRYGGEAPEAIKRWQSHHVAPREQASSGREDLIIGLPADFAWIFRVDR